MADGRLAMVSLTLVWIGGLAWGIFGLTGLVGEPLNVIDFLTFGVDILENLIYVLVGLATLVSVPMTWPKLFR